MDPKAPLNSLVRGIARLPGISQVLHLQAVRKLLARLPGLRSQFAPWGLVHPFDIGYGTDTSGFVTATDLGQLDYEAARTQSIPYAGSQPSIVRAVLRALPRLDAFTFVDLGCGKGRPLLVASEFSFRRIVGVELSASLAKTAQLNAKLIAQRFPKRPPIEVMIMDAGRFELPAGDLVLFLYNPFGDEVITKVAAAVNAALTTAHRTVYVIYYNPVFGRRFDASPLLHRYFAGTLPYASEELGYGPDTEDPIIVWEGGIALGPIDARANARIEIVDPSNRVKLIAT